MSTTMIATLSDAQQTPKTTDLLAGQHNGTHAKSEDVKSTFQGLFSPKLPSPNVFSTPMLDDTPDSLDDLHVVPSTDDLRAWERMIGSNEEEARVEMDVPSFPVAKQLETPKLMETPKLETPKLETPKLETPKIEIVKEENTTDEAVPAPTTTAASTLPISAILSSPKTENVIMEEQRQERKHDATKTEYERLHKKKMREAAIIRFRQKREERRFGIKHVRYECRKKIADSRPRVKGRFVRKQPVVDIEPLSYLNESMFA